MNKTKIEWVKNPDGTQGYTWNPITGCLNHTDGLCNGGGFPCYAYKLAHGRLRSRYLHNWHISTERLPDGMCLSQHPKDDPFYPRFWPERLSCQFSTRTPQGIFVCDMSDLFGIGTPENWTWQVLQLIKAYPQHHFYLLTKQPQNLIKFSPFPDNVWCGVTATNTDMTFEAMEYLLRIEARVKYISFEPLLASIPQVSILKQGITRELDLGFREAGISWVILGSQTKPYKPPRIEWVEEIVKACDKARIPVFLKNNLKPLFESLSGIPQWAYNSKTILRQEMPK